MSVQDLAVLDERRGDLSRSEYLRRLIHSGRPAAPAPPPAQNPAPPGPAPVRRARPPSTSAKPSDPASGTAANHPADHRPSWIGSLTTGRRCSVCKYREVL